MLAVLVLACLFIVGCAGCPPSWSERPPRSDEWLYASASCGEVFVEAEALDVALTRAARRLADELGLDVEARLSVVERDGRVFAEALGPQGPLDTFDALELVDRVECHEVTYVLVRLRRPPEP